MNTPFLPLIERAKRSRRKSRGRSAPALPPTPPPGPPINVADVLTADPPTTATCRWRFDSNITITGLTLGLQVQIDGVWSDPVTAVQGDVDSVDVAYDTIETLDGKAFRIVTSPAGIAQAARIVLPQSGTVAAP